MAAVGQTVAELAHTIKNIANALKGSIFVLGQGVELDDKDYLHQGWRMVSENVEKIKDLSLEMLNFGKYATLTLQPGDLNLPAAEVVRLMENQAHEQGVDLAAELGDDLAPVAFDSGAIHCCLLNLVSNAIDACRVREDSGGRRQVVVRTRPAAGGAVEIQVSDSGCGMDEGVRRRLFQGLFSTKGSEGTGIGLMMTKRIVDQHQGRISLESRTGVGTTLTIHLPHLPPAHPVPARDEPQTGDA
jgi:signal transduction histidine kinase